MSGGYRDSAVPFITATEMNTALLVRVHTPLALARLDLMTLEAPWTFINERTQ
jgi:hypothetical protein